MRRSSSVGTVDVEFTGFYIISRKVQRNSGGTSKRALQAGDIAVADFGAASGVLNINGTTQLNLYNNANFVLGVQNNGAGNGTVNQNGGKVTFFADAGFTPGSSLATPAGLRLGGGTG